MSRAGLCAALVMAALALASPAAAWIFTPLPSTHPTSARALAIDQAGRIVAAGDLDFGAHRIFIVFHLDPDTGNETSAYFHGFQTDGHARAVAIGTTDDDVFAAGEEIGDAADFLVTRSSADGLEAWATRLAGDAGCGDDVALALAVDPQGQPIAAGQITNATPGGNTTAFAVVKLAESDGTVTWRTEIPDGVASAVTVDPAGDVLAAGVVGGAFAVVKLAGATGAVLWQTTLGAGAAVALVTGEAGTVYAAGQRAQSFAVAKLETTGGTELWPTGAGLLEGSGFARAITRLSDGDVVAAGELGTGAGRMFVTTRLGGTDGSITWTDDDPSIPQPAAAYGLDHDDLDDVVSAGTAAHEFGPASFSVRALFGSDGSLAWGTGIVSDDAETRALVVRFDAVGDVLIAGQLALYGLAPSFTVEKLDGATGEDFQTPCGNDQLDPGEDCDDGNTFDGDCCSSTCTFEAQGASCFNEGNTCTDDVCDGAGTCTHPAIADGTPCDDFNPCTSGDTCGNGFCQGAPVTGGSCNDFDPCTTGETCDAGVCRGTLTPGAPCPSDFNPCTDDVCDAQGFCSYPPNAASCDDTNACTTGDHCEQGICVGTPGGGTTTSTSTTTTLATTTTSTSTTTTLATTTTSTSTTTTLATTTTSTSTTTTLATTTTTSTTTTSATTSSTTSTTVTTTTSTTVGPSTTTSTSTTTTAPSSTSTSTTSSTTTTTLPASCLSAVDCDDGDPCNGVEGCVAGRCLAPRGVAGPACPAGDPIAVVSRFRADAVAFCNTRTRTVEATVPVGKSPWGVAWQPDGRRVLVTNRDAATVSVLDAVTRSLVGTVHVGAQPLGVAVHPFLPRAYVASYDDDSVDVIDTGSLAVTARIRVGRGPSGIAVHPAGGHVYVSNYVDGSVSVIDAATNTVVGMVPTPALPVGIAVHPAGTKVYVACLKERQLAVIGTVSDSVLGVVRVGRRPIGVAFDADGARAYVTNSADATVTVLDAAADRVVDKVDVGSFPIGVAVAAGAGIWVADSRDGAMSVIPTSGGAASVPIGDTPVAIGAFIGTPPDGCPRGALACDDANPFTGDACRSGVGCAQATIPGPLGLRAGVAGIESILADPATADDPLAAEIRAAPPALESAVSAAETGGDRTALRLVRRTLKPILRTLERAKRHGTLGSTGTRLLDIAREARRQLKRLARNGA